MRGGRGRPDIDRIRDNHLLFGWVGNRSTCGGVGLAILAASHSSAETVGRTYAPVWSGGADGRWQFVHRVAMPRPRCSPGSLIPAAPTARARGDRGSTPTSADVSATSSGTADAAVPMLQRVRGPAELRAEGLPRVAAVSRCSKGHALGVVKSPTLVGDQPQAWTRPKGGFGSPTTTSSGLCATRHMIDAIPQKEQRSSGR